MDNAAPGLSWCRQWNAWVGLFVCVDRALLVPLREAIGLAWPLAAGAEKPGNGEAGPGMPHWLRPGMRALAVILKEINARSIELWILDGDADGGASGRRGEIIEINGKRKAPPRRGLAD